MPTAHAPCHCQTENLITWRFGLKAALSPPREFLTQTPDASSTQLHHNPQPIPHQQHTTQPLQDSFSFKAVLLHLLFSLLGMSLLALPISSATSRPSTNLTIHPTFLISTRQGWAFPHLALKAHVTLYCNSFFLGMLFHFSAISPRRLETVSNSFSKEEENSFSISAMRSRGEGAMNQDPGLVPGNRPKYRRNWELLYFPQQVGS